MARFVAEPAPADLLDIFGPNSFVPIPLPVLQALLERLLLGMPGYADAGPEQQQALKLLTMHELAAWMPGDVAEASIAATLVALNAHAMDCFRRAALPDVFPEDALRHTRQANSLLRTLATGRRELERRQTARRKAQDTPSERGGYFVAKYESVAPGFVAPSPAPANRAAEPAQEPAPPQPEPAQAAPQATPRSVVTVGDIMQRFAARKIGPGETREQVWDQCTQEALDAARRAA